MNAFKVEMYRRAIQVLANVLVLAAVTFGMYQASQSPENMLSVFSKYFFPLLAGILALAWLALRCVNRLLPVDAADDLACRSVVDLPRYGHKLVRWKVLSSPRGRRKKS